MFVVSEKRDNIIISGRTFAPMAITRVVDQVCALPEFVREKYNGSLKVFTIGEAARIYLNFFLGCPRTTLGDLKPNLKPVLKTYPFSVLIDAARWYTAIKLGADIRGVVRSDALKLALAADRPLAKAVKQITEEKAKAAEPVQEPAAESVKPAAEPVVEPEPADEPAAPVETVEPEVTEPVETVEPETTEPEATESEVAEEPAEEAPRSGRKKRSKK